MAVDRSIYRGIYPQVLKLTNNEAERFINEIHSTPERIQRARENDVNVDAIIQEDKNYFFYLAQDATKARSIKVVRWEAKALSDSIIKNAVRMGRPIQQPAINPFEYLSSSIFPFGMGRFTRFAEETHDLIVRGHGWFGIGKWNVSSWLYMNALSTAIASGNIASIEIIVRFLVDTYIACGDYQSAIGVMSAFLEYLDLTHSNRDITKQGLESIAFGLMLKKEKKEALRWLLRISDVCKSDINPKVEKWNIYELLADVFMFLEDTQKLLKIRQNVNDIEIILSVL